MEYYTTIEQSKKLVELGIDVDTADMYYPYYLEFDKYPSTPLALDDELKNYQLIGEDIPCWSTEALLKLLPRCIYTKDNFVLNDIQAYKDSYRISYTNISYTNYEYKNVIECKYDTLIECAYNMIVKLKELKLL